MGASKPKDLSRIAKICHGYPEGTDLSFNKLHYLRTVKFKHKYILISHVGAEALNTERILTSRTNSPPAQISTQ